MSVHTYIGARYVPRFLGIYDPTQQYEALDVVDNGSGTSYIARDLVPPGTPLTDTDHWFAYGASSGAIIQLQNDMIQAQNDISGLQDDVYPLANQKVVMLCDSYGNRTNGNGQTVGDILTAKGIDLAYYTAISGAGITSLSNHLSDYTGDHDKITDVIYAGGANDNSGTYAGLKTLVVNAISAAKTSYPNARIHIIPWGMCFADTSWAQFLLETTIRSYTDGASEGGAYIAENAQYMLRNTQMLESDMIHPNASGVDYIADKVFGYLKGTPIDVFHQLTATLSSANTNITNVSTGGYINMKRHNGAVTLSHSGAAGVFGTFDHSNVAGNASYNPAFNITDTLISIPQSSSSYYKECNGRELPLSSADWPYGYIGSRLQFLIFGGNQIRILLQNNQFYNTVGHTSLTNTVTIYD